MAARYPRNRAATRNKSDRNGGHHRCERNNCDPGWIGHLDLDQFVAAASPDHALIFGEWLGAPMQTQWLKYLDRRLPRYTSYPTAVQFGPAVEATTYERWLSALPADAPVSLYLHVPFCAELCLYCGCHTTSRAATRRS